MSVDLNTLVSSIRTLLVDANTTTATRDLSNGMTKRIQQVLRVNPARIPIQASYYPCVTVFVSKKDIEQKTIAKDQLTARRQGKVEVKIIGLTWNSTIADPKKDQSVEEAQILMENVEQILRANPTLGGQATWQLPDAVTYHNVAVEEEAHLRAGIMNLDTTIFY